MGQVKNYIEGEGILIQYFQVSSNSAKSEIFNICKKIVSSLFSAKHSRQSVHIPDTFKKRFPHFLPHHWLLCRLDAHAQNCLFL